MNYFWLNHCVQTGWLHSILEFSLIENILYYFKLGDDHLNTYVEFMVVRNKSNAIVTALKFIARLANWYRWCKCTINDRESVHFVCFGLSAKSFILGCERTLSVCSKAHFGSNESSIAEAKNLFGPRIYNLFRKKNKKGFNKKKTETECFRLRWQTTSSMSERA